MKKFIFMEFCKCYVKALQNVNCCYNNHSNEKIYNNHSNEKIYLHGIL